MHDNGQTDGLETRTLTHTRPSITDGLPTGQLAGRRGGGVQWHCESALLYLVNRRDAAATF